MKLLFAAVAIAGLVFTPMASQAAPCRDAKGKFIKCATVTAPAKPKKCRDAKGHFTKCP